MPELSSQNSASIVKRAPSLAEGLNPTLNVMFFLMRLVKLELRARATIRLPDVNIARARKTFAGNTKRNENKFEPFIRKLKVSGSFRRF